MLKTRRTGRQAPHTLRATELSALESLETRRLFAFASLQSAIDSAAPGSTITVAAGTVEELVTVNKPLIIQGAQHGVDARDASRGTGETVVRGGAVSDGTRSTSFLITASGVTIDGFTIQDDSSSNLHGAGIVIAPGVHGTHIVNNIIQSNIAGVYLANNSNTDPAVIQHNIFRNNNNNGENSGRGIYTDGGVSGGMLTRVVIDSNTFEGNVGFGPPENPQAAIGLEAQGVGKQFNVTITNNIMKGNGKGVLLYNIDKVTIAGNVMSASTDTHSAAIRIEGNASNVTVTGNTVTGNLGAAMRVSPIFTGASSNIVVHNNNFFGNTAGGLTVDSGGYKGTLDATNNWWGSDKGPGGIGPGFGDAITAVDGNVKFSPWSTKLITAPSTDSSTPRGLRQILIDDLAAVRDGLQGHARKLVNDAIANLKASLADSLWADDSHLAPNAGETVFRLDVKALWQLRKSIKGFKHSQLPNGLQETVHRIANLERLMAMFAIESAAGGDSRKLIFANRELSAGVKEFDRGNYEFATLHFLFSWKLAIGADRHPPMPKPPVVESNGHKHKKPHKEDKIEKDNSSNDNEQ